MKLSAFLAFGLAALPALGASSGPEGGQTREPGMGQRPRPPIIAALDANSDGQIDASEIANASRALASLDKDANGVLTATELRPPRPEGMGAPGEGGGPGMGGAHRGDGKDMGVPHEREGSGEPGERRDGEGMRPRMAPPLVRVLDSDGDGTLSAAEIAAASSSLAKLDADDDGELTEGEYRPRRGGPDAPPPPQQP